MTSPSSGIKLTRRKRSMKSESMLSNHNAGASLVESISSESVYCFFPQRVGRRSHPRWEGELL